MVKNIVLCLILVATKVIAANNQQEECVSCRDMAMAALKKVIDAPGEIVIDIYNLSGQRVRRLMDSYHDVGHYTISWDGLDERAVPSSSGVYVVTMQNGGVLSTRKIILLK